MYNELDIACVSHDEFINVADHCSTNVIQIKRLNRRLILGVQERKLTELLYDALRNSLLLTLRNTFRFGFEIHATRTLLVSVLCSFDVLNGSLKKNNYRFGSTTVNEPELFPGIRTAGE